jgi:hypothetical protein
MATWGSASTWLTFSTWSADEGGSTISRYYLTPQSSERGIATASPYGEFLRVRVGKTLVKRDGTWRLVRNKRQDWLDACEYVFRGGYDNEVPSSLVDELESAGFVIDVRTTTTTDPPASDGSWGDIATWSARAAW